MARRRSINLTPALVGSAMLHVGIAALALISWTTAKDLKIGPVVPVTIIDGPPADLRQTVEAETAAPAQTMDPAPIADPAPPAPDPVPTPTPPKPVPPKPQPPTPQPAKPTPSPAKPTPVKPTPIPTKSAQAKPKPADKPFDLDALAASVASSVTRKAKPSDAQRGPDRAATASQTQAGAGESARLSASETDALRSKLEKLWNPNCEVEGGAEVVIKLRMRLRQDGRLAGPPEVLGKSGADRAVVEAAAARAVNAVGRGAPYSELPAERYAAWDVVTMNFNAKQACSRR